MAHGIERHICNWKRVGSDKTYVGELVVDGNQIEFYVKDLGNASPAVYIGCDCGHYYKIVTTGFSQWGKNKTLENAASYNVSYVLQQNEMLSDCRDTNGICSFSFMIPELIEWFYGINTVEILPSPEGQEMYAREIILPEIILHDENPRITIGFESSSINETMQTDSRTEVIIKNEPRIFVKYESAVDTNQVIKDIRCLMNFWGLMIGMVTNAIDIRLDIDGQACKSWLNLNRDFSYNTTNRCILHRPRTIIGTIGNEIQRYYTGWHHFFYDEKYDLVRNMFFLVNNRKEIFAEDIFVSYVRILEGYHLRISGDEEKATQLEAAIKASKKKIKKLIFNDEGKPLFSDVLDEVIPGWGFTSSHADNIAGWIAQGFLGRTSLSDRLKMLDNDYFRIIANNASILTAPISTSINAETENQYYKMIVCTRNYYSHFKHDKTNVLSFRQLHDSIFVLKALIIMVFLSQMGFDKDEMRKIMSWDEELGHRTMYLRKPGEKHPIMLD